MLEPLPLQQIDRTFVLMGKRRLSYFSGCDYFRLSSHPELLRAVQLGARDAGLNVAASRLTTGSHRLFTELEKKVARFFCAEDAILVSSGYLSSTVVAQALAGEFSHALLDERAHPALLDAARFLECPVLRFCMCDPAAVQDAVKRCGPEARILLMTDGMFSSNGMAAPLAKYLEVLPRDAWILVDDAHGAGVLGRNGRGTLEEQGVGRKRIVQTLTLSKAFGSFGGVILGTRGLRRKIIERAHAYAGSTPIPLPFANAAIKAVEILTREGRALRERMQANSRLVKDQLRDAGLALPDAPGPIVPLVTHSPKASALLRQRLLKAEIYPPFVRYPNAPADGYFRFVISSEHQPAQLQVLVEELKRAV